MTHALILNIVIGAAAFAAVIGLLAWSIAAQADRRRVRTRRPVRRRPDHTVAGVALQSETAAE